MSAGSSTGCCASGLSDGGPAVLTNPVHIGIGVK